MSTDGLSSLIAKREKATSSRHLPPARNAPRKAAPAAKSVEATPEKPPKASSTADAKAVARPEKGEPTINDMQLVRATVYVLASDDDWLEKVSQAARSRRPRVDASRSAVSRLALARLRETLSAEEIVNILESRAATSSQVNGRKRL